MPLKLNASIISKSNNRKLIDEQMRLRQALMPIKIFFCYAHENEPLLKKLKSHLRPLQREGLIDIWHDRDISAGMEWEKAIDENLNTAQIILLLVSPDFMNSDYCYSIEMKRALERHVAGEARVIPIILRPVDWKHSPLGKLQALPKDGKPVTNWPDQDGACFNVAEGIRKFVESYLAEKKDPYYIYIHATRGKPVLTDPMSSQSASDWLVGDWDDSSFFFSEGAFHLIVKKHPIYAPSEAKATHFSDFAFQTEMTLISGDGGGMVFRSGVEVAGGYRFFVGRDYVALFCEKERLLYEPIKIHPLKQDFADAGWCSPSPVDILNYTNLLTVVARGSDIFLYINGQSVAYVQDNTAKSGKIGLMAISYTQDTHVQFRNVQVWDLREGMPSFF